MDKQPLMSRIIAFACLSLSILYHMKIKYKNKVININPHRITKLWKTLWISLGTTCDLSTICA